MLEITEDGSQHDSFRISVATLREAASHANPRDVQPTASGDATEVSAR